MEGAATVPEIIEGEELAPTEKPLTRVPLLCRIDTLDELDYYRNGGILHYVLRGLARDAA